MSTKIYNQPIPVRLSNITLRQLQDLKIKWGENRSQVIIRCIERIWWAEVGSKELFSQEAQGNENKNESNTTT